MKTFPVYLQALLAMIIGAGVGLYWGKEAASLGIVSKVLIEIVKGIAIPLLFLAITDGIVSAEVKGRGLAALFIGCIINACGAITIALVISNMFKAGRYLPFSLSHQEMDTASQWMANLGRSLESGKKVSLLNATTNSILSGIVMGVVISLLKKSPVTALQTAAHKIAEWNKIILKWLFVLVEKLVYLIPLAVFTSVAKGVGLYGLSVIAGLFAYFSICLLGMLLHVLIVYQGWIRLVIGFPLKRFWRGVREPVIYSFGINSSLATLPITLQSLRRLGVSDSSARLSACVGTNFNNDGILLYEVVAALFLIQSYGITIGLGQQLIVAVICLVATLGVAGIPEAGLISLTLVLAALGLPAEALATILSVDWVLGRCRSATNVLGDITGGFIIDWITGQRLPKLPKRVLA